MKVKIKQKSEKWESRRAQNNCRGSALRSLSVCTCICQTIALGELGGYTAYRHFSYINILTFEFTPVIQTAWGLPHMRQIPWCLPHMPRRNRVTDARCASRHARYRQGRLPRHHLSVGVREHLRGWPSRDDQAGPARLTLQSQVPPAAERRRCTRPLTPVVQLTLNECAVDPFRCVLLYQALFV